MGLGAVEQGGYRSPALRTGIEWRGSAPLPGQFYAEYGPLGGPTNRLETLLPEGFDLEGEPLAFGQPSMEVWAVSAPERTGEPFSRILVRPHSARPYLRLPLWRMRRISSVLRIKRIR